MPDHVLCRVVDGVTIVLDIENGRTFSLDPVGTRAWQALVESQSIQQALERLAAEYDGDVRVIERDVMTLIDELVAGDLLRVQQD
jgi:hypothetical protein